MDHYWHYPDSGDEKIQQGIVVGRDRHWFFLKIAKIFDKTHRRLGSEHGHLSEGVGNETGSYSAITAFFLQFFS